MKCDKRAEWAYFIVFSAQKLEIWRGGERIGIPRFSGESSSDQIRDVAAGRYMMKLKMLGNE